MTKDKRLWLKNVEDAAVDDLVERVAARHGQPISIESDAFHWLSVHGALCLALRHPAWSGTARAAVAVFVQKLSVALVAAEILTPELALEAQTEIEREKDRRGGLSS